MTIYLTDDAFRVKAKRFNKMFTSILALFFLLSINFVFKLIRKFLNQIAHLAKTCTWMSASVKAHLLQQFCHESTKDIVMVLKHLLILFLRSVIRKC